MKPRVLRLGVAFTVLAGFTAATSSAVTPGESFTVSPSGGAPFTVVSVSGANCVGQSAAAELENVSGDDFPGGTGTIAGAFIGFFATPDGNGDWSGTFTIPPIVPTGQYRVVARCGSDTYGPQPFEVLPGELASMAVTPTRAVAGTDVVLSVSGTLCRSINGQDVARVDLADFEAADEFLVRESVSPDPAGTWSAALTIPAGTPAGMYFVAAQCVINGFQFFIYLPSQLIVLEPAAIPAFTG
jgi:hypothetical protein